MIFVRRVDKVLNFRYNKKVKIESCTNCTANFLCTFVIFAMYLTRTAGIETGTRGADMDRAMYVSYPHCGN